MSDRAFMRDVMADTGLGDRVQMVRAGLSAPELKWAIGRCAVFVGARMHATVGAFSMGVPTVSLSYSSKSVGINLDVLGNTEFVIAARDVTPPAVAERTARALAEADSLRRELAARLPGVKARAQAAGEIVMGL